MAHTLEINFDGDFDALRRKAEQFRDEQAKKPIRIPVEYVDAKGAGGQTTFAQERQPGALGRTSRGAEIAKPQSSTASQFEVDQHNRQMRQIDEQMRMNERLSNQRFETRIADMGPGGRQAALRSRADSYEDYDPLYAETLRTRAAKTRGGFFGKPSSARMAALGLFAAHEAANFASGLAMFDNPVLNRDSLQSLQTQQQAIEKLSSGIVGGLARGADDFLDYASILGGASTKNMQRGFGILGQYSPMAMQSAQLGAQQAIARLGTQTSLASRGMAMNRDNAVAMYTFDASNRNPMNGFENRREDARFQARQAIQELNDEGTALQLKFNSAQSQEEKNAAEMEINQFNRTSGSRRQAIIDRKVAAINSVGAERGMAIADIERSLPELQAVGEGRFGLANNLAFLRQQQEERARTDVSLWPQLEERQKAQTQARDAEISESIKQRDGSTTSDQLRMSRRFIEADLSDIGEARRVALSKARNFEDVQSINRRFDMDENLRGMSESDQNSTIKMGIQDRRMQLGYALARNSAGVDASGIANQGLEAADQLRKAGKGWAATGELENTKMQLDLYRRSRLEGFESENFSRTYDDISNPKDQEDPAQIMSTIKDQVDRVLQYLAELAGGN